MLDKKYDKKYEVYLCGQIPCGVFNGIRSFVENYYYTPEIHKQFLLELKEEDDNIELANHSYEDSVQFYINDIKVWSQHDALDGFEWDSYYFKEVK